MTADGEARSRRRPTVTTVPLGAPAPGRQPSGPAVKPTPAALGVDLAALDWQRSGTGHGSFEIAFVAGLQCSASPGDQSSQSDQPDQPDQLAEPGDASRADWILLRVAGDPEGRVLVYDRNEWICFLDGAWRGEFDSPEGLTRDQVA